MQQTLMITCDLKDENLIVECANIIAEKHGLRSKRFRITRSKY